MNSNIFRFLNKLEQKKRLKTIQLKPFKNLNFPAQDYMAINENLIYINFFGLYGVDSVLPHYFIQAACQDTNFSKTLRAFMDIFNQRLYELFYFVEKKHHLLMAQKNDQNYLNYLIYISGRNLNFSHQEEFASAGILGQRSKNCAGLAALLKTYFKSVPIYIEPNISQWQAVASEKNMMLGCNIILGQKIWDNSSVINITIGPLNTDKALYYLKNFKIIKLIQDYCTVLISPRIYFLILPDHKNILYLNQQNPCSLGWMTWLGKLSADHVIYKLLINPGFV